MKQLTTELKQQAVFLITQLRSGKLHDEQLSEVITKLRAILPDPHFMSYTIDHVPELSPETVIRRAFEYKRFQL
jgi:hypothetical protein